jgi:hypothetical protein
MTRGIHGIGGHQTGSQGPEGDRIVSRLGSGGDDRGPHGPHPESGDGPGVRGRGYALGNDNGEKHARQLDDDDRGRQMRHRLEQQRSQTPESRHNEGSQGRETDGDGWRANHESRHGDDGDGWRAQNEGRHEGRTDDEGNRSRWDRGNDDHSHGRRSDGGDDGDFRLRDYNRGRGRDGEGDRVLSNSRRFDPPTSDRSNRNAFNSTSHTEAHQNTIERGRTLSDVGRNLSESNRASDFNSRSFRETVQNSVDNLRSLDFDTRALGDSLHEARTSRELLQSATNYLRGVSDGASLAPETRSVLDAVAGMLGKEVVDSLDNKATGNVLKVVEHALDHLNRTVEHAPNRTITFLDNRGHEHVSAYGLGSQAPDQNTRGMVEEILVAAQLNQHLKHLEKTGGQIVQRAEAAIARLLYGPMSTDKIAPGPQPAFVGQTTPSVEPRFHPVEILRDLRTGAFLPTQVIYDPFPLTGRARVVSEMMELLHTLDRIEGAIRQAASQASPAQKSTAESVIAAWMKARLAGGSEAALEELLSLLVLPTLPFRAARNEIPRMVAALGGLLTDTEGCALLARDGTPLKLDRLIWLSTMGGLVSPTAADSALATMLPARLSSLLVYGFDAIYTVIGFDGRALAAPHFVSVQAAINDSEYEWVFGQPPFTDGWARELIERLKDSAVVEHNVFGEMLEEAITDGRFHVALLNVAVQEGAPVENASSVKRLYRGDAGIAGAPAFA